MDLFFSVQGGGKQTTNSFLQFRELRVYPVPKDHRIFSLFCKYFWKGGNACNQYFLTISKTNAIIRARLKSSSSKFFHDVFFFAGKRFNSSLNDKISAQIQNTCKGQN